MTTNDDLGFGSYDGPAPKRLPAEAPRAPRPNRTPAARPWLIAVGLLVAAVMVFGFMKFISKSGQTIAKDQVSVVKQADLAKDVEAKTNLTGALSAAKILSAPNGSYDTITAAAMQAAEPSFHYTSGSSTGPSVIAVAAGGGAVGLAARSGSGTCFWIRDTATGTLYGQGTTCTGHAALSAAGKSW